MSEKIGENFVARMAQLGVLELREAFNPSRDSVAQNYFYNQGNAGEGSFLDQAKQMGQGQEAHEPVQEHVREGR